jgi:hypothetical protein
MAKKRKKNQQNQSQQNQAIDYEKAFKEVKQSIKSFDRKVFKSVPKGVQYDWLNNTSFNNVVYPKDKIPDRLLRLIERRNGIVGSIITLRIQQALEFSHISEDKDVPGWEFALKDPKKTLNPKQKTQKEFLENLLINTQRDDYQSLEPKTDTFKDLLIKYARDRLLIDKVVWELERDRKGQTAALWVLDGATILPVLPGGFYGSTSQISTGIYSGFNRLSEEIAKAKLDDIPPIEEISYIQELLYGTSGGGITAAFRETDVIYDLGNELNDIRYYKQGMSVVEKANIAVVAFINSITFNSNGLSRGAIPKVAIAMGKDSSYTEEQLEDMQDEWAANFEAMDGQWNIPLLNGDAKILNMLPNNRDMEYQKYMEFTGALTCALMGADSAEIGLRLNQAQNVMSENQDGKQIFSKNRGVREMLGGFAYIVNQFLKNSGYDFADDFVFRFNGLSTEDKDFEVELLKKKVETHMTVDEVRAERDLKPLPDGQGEIILNAVFMQNKQAAEMAAQGMGEEGEEGFGGFSDEETDGMVDEAMSDMNKSVRLI